MVVFDLDDTLYPEIDYVKSGREAVMHHAPDMDIDGIWTPEMLETYRNHVPIIYLSSDARRSLDALRGAGIKVGIITDGRSVSQRNKFNALGLNNYVADSNLIISEETGADKTTDLPWRKIMEQNPNERQWIYIGDNPAKDFKHANDLGWTTVMLKDIYGHNIHPQTLPPDSTYHPKVIIETLYDYIIELIRK